MTSFPKAASALAALILAFGLAGCGNEPAGDANAPKADTAAPGDTTAPAANPGPAVTPSPTPSLPDAGGKDAAPKADEPKSDAPPATGITKGDDTSTGAPKLEAPDVKKEDAPK